MTITQNIKAGTLSILSYILFLLFVFNFRVVTIEALFSINNYLWYMFLVSLISASFFTTSLIYFSENSEKYVWFTLFLSCLCILTGSTLLLQEFDKSLILSIIVCLAFIPAVLIPVNMRKSLIKISPFNAFAKIQRYITLFLALSFALSFFYYENLDTNNPRLATFMNSFIDQTTNNALKTVGIKPKDITPTITPTENKDAASIKEKVEKELSSLKGEDLQYYIKNKGFIDGLINGVVEGKLQPETVSETPLTKGIKSTVNNIVNEYKSIFLVIGSILVYFFISSVFYFSGIVTIPVFTIIYKMLIKMGIYEKVKKNIEVERLDL